MQRRKDEVRYGCIRPSKLCALEKYTFSAAKDYKNLLKETIAITENNGIIVASTNCSAFDMKSLKALSIQPLKK